MRMILIIGALVLLAGCQKDIEARERDDDASCRQLIAERNDARPTAYQECRANLMQYREQKATALSGRTHININR